VHGREKDYFLDKANTIYRSIIASGRTKSGFRPTDFIWNSEFKNYIPVAMLKKNKVDLSNVHEMPKWDPLRQYNKPWQSAGKKSGAGAEVVDDDAKSAKSGGGGGGWLSTDRKKKHRVEPAPNDVTHSPSSGSLVSGKSGGSKKKAAFRDK